MTIGSIKQLYMLYYAVRTNFCVAWLNLLPSLKIIKV